MSCQSVEDQLPASTHKTLDSIPALEKLYKENLKMVKVFFKKLLEVEVRVMCLLGKRSTTRVTPPSLTVKILLERKK
jgi:hypothetical protein